MRAGEAVNETARRARGDRSAITSLAMRLARAHEASEGLSISWLNHYSALAALETAVSMCAKEMSLIGIDGKLLQRIIGAPARTSADTVLPIFLRQTHDARVALIGGMPGTLEARTRAFEMAFGENGHVVANVHGYWGGKGYPAVRAEVVEARPTIAIVGMAPGQQEQVASQLRADLPSAIVATCGGFLDQLVVDRYYPTWAYPLRLNWLVRLVREPRRLTSRYTFWAARALLQRQTLKSYVRDLPGYAAYAALCVIVENRGKLIRTSQRCERHAK
jgi:exopolysaccharide biosynthesis WecB/TagA/CpsF family protein